MFDQWTAAERSAVSRSLRAADRARVRCLLQRALIHELRSPLQAACFYLDLLSRALDRDEPPSPEDRWHRMQHVERLSGQLQRFGELLEGLVPLPESSVSSPEAIDVVETLPRLLGLLQRRRTLPAIHLERELPAGPEHVVSVDGGVEHAFLSVALNAFEAMSEGGTLVLRIRRVDPQRDVLWEIEDEGTGIPAVVKPRIFEPYVSTKEGHAGLGLFVARELVHEHGGTMEIAPGEGRGTRATVRLPRTSPPPERPSEEDSACRTRC